MKIKLLFMALLLSGCNNDYLYDEKVAPVLNQNSYPNRNPVQLQVQNKNTDNKDLERQKAQRDAQARAAANKQVQPAGDSWDIKPQEPKANNSASAKSSPATVKKEEPPTISDEPKFERVKNNAQNPQKAATEKVEKAVSESKAKAEKKVEEVKSSAPTREIAREEPVKKKEPSQVDGLLSKAAKELEKGDLEKAVSYLNDASKLKKDPKIYYDIANIRYHQGKYREAESAASQAIKVGGADKNTQKKIWSLIANSRDANGDKSGAKAAADTAADL